MWQNLKEQIAIELRYILGQRSNKRKMKPLYWLHWYHFTQDYWDKN